MIGPKTKAWLQSRTDTADSRGGRSYTWTNKVLLLGVLSPVSAQEQLISGRDALRITHKYVFAKSPVKDYTQYINGKSRLFINSKTYKIVEPLEYQNFYELQLERDA